jgi:hypothetical protein
VSRQFFTLFCLFYFQVDIMIGDSSLIVAALAAVSAYSKVRKLAA